MPFAIADFHCWHAGRRSAVVERYHCVCSQHKRALCLALCMCTCVYGDGACVFAVCITAVNCPVALILSGPVMPKWRLFPAGAAGSITCQAMPLTPLISAWLSFRRLEVACSFLSPPLSFSFPPFYLFPLAPKGENLPNNLGYLPITSRFSPSSPYRVRILASMHLPSFFPFLCITLLRSIMYGVWKHDRSNRPCKMQAQPTGHLLFSSHGSVHCRNNTHEAPMQRHECQGSSRVLRMMAP